MFKKAEPIVASGAITPGSSSEIKKNISYISTEDAMDAVMGLNPVSFQYKSDTSGEEYLCFIAELLQDVSLMLSPFFTFPSLPSQYSR